MDTCHQEKDTEMANQFHNDMEFVIFTDCLAIFTCVLFSIILVFISGTIIDMLSPSGYYKFFISECFLNMKKDAPKIKPPIFFSMKTTRV